MSTRWLDRLPTIFYAVWIVLMCSIIAYDATQSYNAVFKLHKAPWWWVVLPIALILLVAAMTWLEVDRRFQRKRRADLKAYKADLEALQKGYQLTLAQYRNAAPPGPTLATRALRGDL